MRALVTGGGGFLGGALARRLKAEGWSVVSLARGSYPELAAAGIETVRASLEEPYAVRAAAKGADVVFHVAAKVGLWGSYEEFRRVNVGGTRAVIDACLAEDVRKLVFTSSPSVVFDGGDCAGWDETAPYPERFDSHYSATKAAAEELVLAADGPRLSTVALRPHLVWGPGDRHIAPRLIAQAREGRLRRVGDFDKKVDTTYIDDAVSAHLLAAARLGPGAPCAGRAYFVSQGEPWPLWKVIDGILASASLPPVTARVPYPVAWGAACALEAVWSLGLPGEPRLTRFLVKQLTTEHWFDISAAKRDLGYSPSVSMAEGMRRLGPLAPGS